MTPTEIITKATARLEAATTDASMEVALDTGIGAIGALLDLGLISVHIWRAAIDNLDAMAEKRQAEPRV
ncbi:hypothetical protein D3C84_1081220 [compost metagenome]